MEYRLPSVSVVCGCLPLDEWTPAEGRWLPSRKEYQLQMNVVEQGGNREAIMTNQSTGKSLLNISDFVSWAITRTNFVGDHNVRTLVCYQNNKCHQRTMSSDGR